MLCYCETVKCICKEIYATLKMNQSYHHSLHYVFEGFWLNKFRFWLLESDLCGVRNKTLHICRKSFCFSMFFMFCLCCHKSKRGRLREDNKRCVEWHKTKTPIAIVHICTNMREIKIVSAFVRMNMVENRKHKSIKGFYFCMYEVYKQIAIKRI